MSREVNILESPGKTKQGGEKISYCFSSHKKNNGGEVASIQTYNEPQRSKILEKDRAVLLFLFTQTLKGLNLEGENNLTRIQSSMTINTLETVSFSLTNLLHLVS